MKKILAIILSAILLVMNIPVFASAAISGSGTDTDPYIIETAEDFEKIREKPTATYTLAADITLPASYMPIPEFKGKLIGSDTENYKSITVNMNLAKGKGGGGLFNTLTGATVKYLKVEGSINCVDNSTGSLAGTAKDSVIEYYENYATITSTGAIVGGCIGNVGTSTIQYVHNFGDITASYFVGGICQTGDTTAYRCSNHGNITGTSTTGYVGGIAALNYIKAVECYNTGTIKGGTYVGGINGSPSYNKCNITDCYNTGKIISTNASENNVRLAGGIVGSHNSKATNTKSTFKNVYNIGIIENNSTEGKVSPITSDFDNAGTMACNISGGYYLENAKAEQVPGTMPLTDAQMKDLSNFVEFSSEVWTIDPDAEYKYPVLINNMPKKTFTVKNKIEDKYVLGSTIEFKTSYNGMKPKYVSFYVNGKEIAKDTEFPYETSYKFPEECGLYSVVVSVNYNDGSKIEINKPVTVVKDLSDAIYIEKAGTINNSIYSEGVHNVNADSSAFQIEINGLEEENVIYDIYENDVKVNSLFTDSYIGGIFEVTPTRELISDSVYTIIIDGSTLLSDGITPLGYSFTIAYTTEKHNYDVESVKLVIGGKDYYAGDAVSFKTGDSITAEFKVRNNEAGDKDFKYFIIATGENDYLSSFNMKDGTIAADTASKTYKTDAITLKSGQVRITLFVLDDLDNKTLIATPVIFE